MFAQSCLLTSLPHMRQAQVRYMLNFLTTCIELFLSPSACAPCDCKVTWIHKQAAQRSCGLSLWVCTHEQPRTTQRRRAHTPSLAAILYVPMLQNVWLSKNEVEHAVVAEFRLRSQCTSSRLRSQCTSSRRWRRNRPNRTCLSHLVHMTLAGAGKHV